MDMEPRQERRSQRRRSLPPNTVFVYHDGHRVFRCPAADASEGGTFLRTRGFPLLPGASVDLVLVFKVGDLIQTYRKRGVVVRVGEDGAGIRFVRTAQGRRIEAARRGRP
jgi:hypothetical protein